MSSSPEFQDGTPVPVDRSERRVVTMRGYVILEDGTHHQISLLDLSYEGCGVETDAALTVGDQVKLSVLSRGAVGAEVRWVRDGKAGLAFIPPEEEERKFWERKAERVATAAEVTMRRRGQTNYRLSVNDLSAHGCKVELVERPSIGDTMLVKFDGLDAVDSEVIWVEGPVAGLRFVNPVHAAVLDLLLQRLASA